MKVYLVNGTGGVGKSTFEKFVLQEVGNFGFQVSTVDFVKEVAKFCGWDGVKDAKNRKFLSDLKDLLTEWGDVPLREVNKAITHELLVLEQYGFDDKVATFFVDVREPSELDKFKSFYNAKTILIRREVPQLAIYNHADADVENYEYDIYIDNNGDLEELRAKARQFVKDEDLFTGYKVKK